MARANHRQSGVSLMELMAVIAIIGILASVAIFTFGKSSNKARITSEVNQMFTKFQTAQEQYNAENGEYLSTGTDESDTFPTSPSGNRKPNNATSPPATWDTLRVSAENTGLYCSYVAVAGDGGDDANVGSLGTQFGFTVPDVNWYYVVAECDTDGKGGTNALYFASSATEGTFKQNEGR